MQSYEIEIKSLLGSPERAEKMRKAMKKADPVCSLISKNKQLNHYFKDGTLQRLCDATSGYLSKTIREKLKDFNQKAKEFSVRTRDKDPSNELGTGGIYLVVKASIDDTTSANGISRMEFEERVPITLEKLDKLVLSAGFSYEAKWSREREEYLCKGTNVTLDKNAGYGWLAEFEKIVDSETKTEDAQRAIRDLMQELAVQELSQERLGRMFAYYNENWPEYYGTEKIFVVE